MHNCKINLGHSKLADWHLLFFNYYSKSCCFAHRNIFWTERTGCSQQCYKRPGTHLFRGQAVKVLPYIYVSPGHRTISYKCLVLNSFGVIPVCFIKSLEKCCGFSLYPTLYATCLIFILEFKRYSFAHSIRYQSK